MAHTGLLEVVSGDLRELRRGARAPRFQPVREMFVSGRALRLRDAAVGRVPHQLMAEAERRSGVDRGRADEVACDERVDRRRDALAALGRRERCDGLERKQQPFHRGVLDRQPLGLAQEIEAAGQKRIQRDGQRLGGRLVGLLPARLGSGDPPRVDEHLAQLLEEKRIAARTRDQSGA